MMLLFALAIALCAPSISAFRAAKGIQFAHHNALQLQFSPASTFSSSPLLCTSKAAEAAEAPQESTIIPAINNNEIKRKRDAFLKIFSNEKFSRESMGKLGLNMVLA